MNNIVKFWPYTSLSARWEDDRIPNNKDKSDFIITTLKEWHQNDVGYFRLFTIPNIKNGTDYTYLVVLNDCIIIANLGTDNKRSWMDNIFGTLKGLFTFGNIMNPAFAIPGHRLYLRVGSFLSNWSYRNPGKPIYNVMHSRGIRGLAMAYYLKKNKNIDLVNIAYCPPPIWTRKGLKKCNLNSTIVLSPGDFVDNLGFFKFKHCGKIIKLKKNKEWLLNKRFLGSHAYSSITNNLIKTYPEYAEYLRLRSFVDET